MFLSPVYGRLIYTVIHISDRPLSQASSNPRLIPPPELRRRHVTLLSRFALKVNLRRYSEGEGLREKLGAKIEALNMASKNMPARTNSWQTKMGKTGLKGAFGGPPDLPGKELLSSTSQLDTRPLFGST